ncbi:MAG: DUF2314 domain-containing protein [Chloroflexota bacterium]
MKTRIFALSLLMFALAACAPAAGPAPDAEFEQAVSRARESLDEFKTLLQSPNPTRTFAALKVRFTSPDGQQDIWVDNVTYEDGEFHGLMGDDLPALRLAFGERVDVPVEDILDWMIVEDGRLIGGYTIRLAYSRMTPEEKEFFLKDAGYSIDE